MRQSEEVFQGDFSNSIWQVSTSGNPQGNTGRCRWGIGSVTIVTHVYITPTLGELSIVLWHICIICVRICAFPVAVNG
jgi:hypothetical protein